MTAGVENHEDLTSIIKQAIGEHYQTKSMENGITKINI
jgi:hypothetical protein